MKLYLIRHGETNFNSIRKVQGIMDNELNETGIKQAYEVKEKLKDVVPDIVMSSSLVRAKKTAEIINENYNLEHVIDDIVIERDFGELEGGCADFIYTIKDFSIYEKFEQNDALQKRAQTFLDSLEDKTYIVVAHSHFIKSVIMLLDETYTYLTPLKNCAIVVIDDNNTYKII